MNKDFVNLATPTSHLFKSDVNADSISEKSDCLELREFMIGKIDRLKKNVMLAHLDEVDITLPWNQERKALITDVIKNYQNLKLVTFHMSCNCTSPVIDKGVFQPGGKTMVRTEMLDNVRKNIEWLKQLLPENISIAVENNNYYPTEAYSDVTDSSFIREVVTKNEVNFLFDISHALVTCFNKNIEYSDYISDLPLEKTIQIHLCSPGVREDNLAYDLHLLPDSAHIEHALSLANKFSAEYLTVEYYKNIEKLLSCLDAVRDQINTGLGTKGFNPNCSI